MYDAEFGTDWETLDKEEAVDRAFALGVLDSAGRPDREEYERVHAEVDTSYHRSMVELAYEEGKRKAAKLERLKKREGTAPDPEDLWAELVDLEAPDRDEDAVGGRDGIPSALSRTDLLERLDPDDREALGFPDFLER